jgi:NAD+ kinase
MKIALIGKMLADDGYFYVQLLVSRLEAYGFQPAIHRSFYEIIRKKVQFMRTPEFFTDETLIQSGCDLLLTVGGDGTLLDTITLVRDSKIPILGVNLGRLGFLASVNKEQIDFALLSIKQNDFCLEERALLQIETTNNHFGELNFALNDVTVYKKDPNSMLKVNVSVNDEFLNTYWGDGLIIATPTGSTAYSLSCGGPIMTPDSGNFILTPVAPHTLTVRPLVIPDSSVLKIYTELRSIEYLVSLDSRAHAIEANTELTLRKAPFSIQLVRMNNHHFFNTIREKLMWGIDARK